MAQNSRWFMDFLSGPRYSKMKSRVGARKAPAPGKFFVKIVKVWIGA